MELLLYCTIGTVECDIEMSEAQHYNLAMGAMYSTPENSTGSAALNFNRTVHAGSINHRDCSQWEPSKATMGKSLMNATGLAEINTAWSQG